MPTQPRKARLNHVTVTLDPTRHWECPSCQFQHVTRIPAFTTEFHQCPRQRGAYVPLIDVTNQARNPQKVRHVVVERGDYIADEYGVRHDAEGKAIMGVRTERFDGSNDAVVFPATAQVKGRV